MRRLFLAWALLAGLIAIPPGADARTAPSITVPRLIPLTVKGTGFVAGERVRVMVRVGATFRKTVTAGRRGRFLLVYRLATNKCTTVRVIATGNKGSRATATVPATCRP
jgi:hypothetical protein